LALCVAFYRGSDAALLVYDVTNPKSIDNLEKWLEEIYKNCAPPSREHFPIYVLGNKIDEQIPEISENKTIAENWCKSKKLKHMCVSAITSENLENTFYQLAVQVDEIERRRLEIDLMSKESIPFPSIKTDFQPSKSSPQRFTLEEMRDNEPQTKPCCG